MRSAPKKIARRVVVIATAIASAKAPTSSRVPRGEIETVWARALEGRWSSGLAKKHGEAAVAMWVI
jgi:hypothetical protein